MVDLKEVLERLYHQYHSDYIPTDPVWAVHRFHTKEEQEIVGLIASLLAYGQVKQIQKAIETVLRIMEGRPHRFVLSFHRFKDSPFRGFRHRFTTEREMDLLITLLNRVYRDHGSLEAFYMEGYDPADDDIRPSLTSFVERSRTILGKVTGGFHSFLPSPSKGSACKRLNLFLRWMVRDDGIDLGLWKGIPPSKLIIPLDTHMARISRGIGLTRRKTPDWKMAKEITERLKALNPQDPVRYDFSLTRLGILKRYEDLLPYADINL